MSRSDGVYSSVSNNQTIATSPPSHSEGTSSVASGLNSHAEGQSTLASGDNSHSGGVYSIAPRFAQLSRASGVIGQTPGEAQYGQVYLMLHTTDNKPNTLLIGGVGGSLFVLENEKSYVYNIMIVARSNVSGLSKIWACKCGAKKSAAGVSRIGAAIPVVTIIAEDGGATAGWTVLVDVSAGTNSLDISVQDIAGGTINWMAVIEWAEVYLSLPS